MDEETKKEEEVKEGEVEEIKDEEVKEEVEESSEEDVAKKKKREFYFELALFLILGLLIGIALKTEASKRITIGYEDYKMKIRRQDYKIGELQANLEKANEQAAEEGQQNVPQEEVSPEMEEVEGEAAPNGEAESALDEDSQQGAEDQME